MKGIFKFALVSVGAFGLYKFFRGLSATKVSENLYTEMKPKIEKVDANPFTGGIDLVINVHLKNPTKKKLTFTQPYVEVLSKGEAFVSSDVSNKVHILEPLSEINIDPIKIKIGWTKFLNLLSQVKFEFPEGLTVLKKIVYVVSNINKVLDQLELESKYSHYANGFFNSVTEKF